MILSAMSSRQCAAYVKDTQSRCKRNVRILNKYCWLHYPKKSLLVSTFISFFLSVWITFYFAPRISFFLFNLLEPKPLTFIIKRERINRSQYDGRFRSVLDAHNMNLTPIIYVYELHIKNNTQKVLLKDINILFDFSGPIYDWQQTGGAYSKGIEVYSLSTRKGSYGAQKFMNFGMLDAGGFYDAEVLVAFPDTQMAERQAGVGKSASYSFQGHGLTGRASIFDQDPQTRL